MDAVELLEKWLRICRKNGSCYYCPINDCPICQNDLFMYSEYGEALDFRSFVNTLNNLKEENDDL